MPDYEIRFTHTAAFDEPLVVGDAIRWVGPLVWQVEEVDEDHHIVRVWPSDEPYPTQIREAGPGEWPDDD